MPIESVFAPHFSGEVANLWGLWLTSEFQLCCRANRKLESVDVNIFHKRALFIRRFRLDD